MNLDSAKNVYVEQKELRMAEYLQFLYRQIRQINIAIKEFLLYNPADYKYQILLMRVQELHKLQTDK